MIGKLKYFILAFGLSACMGVDGGAVPGAIEGVMPRGAQVRAPNAFLDYCERNPSDCAIPSTSSLNRALNEVNSDVRQIIIPTEENGGDFWQRLDDVGPGDCEDFALTFRHRLRALFPAYASAFRLATAFTEDGQYHAVLSVETSTGTVVCDIRFPACAPWETFPYRWRMREIAGTDTWELFDEATIQTATAAIKARGRR
jgi:predicted transglutaminase-like cysteine proteinase